MTRQTRYRRRPKPKTPAGFDYKSALMAVRPDVATRVLPPESEAVRTRGRAHTRRAVVTPDAGLLYPCPKIHDASRGRVDLHGQSCDCNNPWSGHHERMDFT